MAYTALYREWRPKSFEDLIGQEHIKVTLRNQMSTGRIAHAYLLCGTRGTGKTTTAKIISKAVNCLDPKDGDPCNKCAMCLSINAGTAIDVTELDAASHNGVDKIRDIIEDVQYPPQEAKFKVYIIDEVHMLSIGAVNAFLKTLEEPPEKVIFILATTDPQKLPITIISRCQRFDFRRIKSSDIFDRLRTMVQEIGVYAEDESLKLIARMSDGAMRDAQSILDQAISMGDGNIEYNELLDMLGLVTNDNMLKLSDSIIDKNIEVAIKLVDEIIFGGKDVYTFIRDMTIHLRNLMMVKISQKPEDIIDMSLENIKLLQDQAQKIRIEEIMRDIRIFQEAAEQSKWSKQSRIYLELAILKCCKVEYDTSKEVMLMRLNKLEEAMKSGEISVSCEAIIPRYVEVEKGSKNSGLEEIVIKPKEEFNPTSGLDIEKVKKKWKDILETIKSRHLMVLYASLMTGELLTCQGGIIEIKFSKDYSFSKQRLDREDNKKIIEGIFSEELKESIRIKYIVEKEIVNTDTKEARLKATFGEDIVEILDE
ncbi:MAG TPA: DNA polymerase III subunit gamma/tau [Clostridiaceae bacterium]